MTQIEQIKAEIERLYCEEAERFDTSQEIGAKRILDELSKYINSLPAEQQSEDLEAEIDRYFKDDKWFSTPLGDIAHYFAKWQKEQIIKSAIDGCWIKRNRYTKENVLNGFSVTCEAIQKFKDGDKVKVIIVKEDEQ